MITVTGPDGAVHSFPDETSPDVIKGVMQQHYGAPQPPEATDAAVFKQGPTEQSVGAPQSFAAGAGDAMLMGFGPQIAGASEYTANLGAPGSYDRGKQQYEDRQATAQESNPGWYRGGESTAIGATMLTPGAGTLAAKGLGYGMRMTGAATRAAALPAAAVAGLKTAPLGPWVAGPAAMAAYRGTKMTGGRISKLGQALLDKVAPKAAEAPAATGTLSKEMRDALKRGKFRHQYHNVKGGI